MNTVEGQHPWSLVILQHLCHPLYSKQYCRGVLYNTYYLGTLYEQVLL